MREGLFRRVVALYLCSAIGGMQLLFVLEEVLRLTLPLGPTGPMMTTGFPVLGTALALWRGWLRPAPVPRAGLWLAVGAGLFALWAGGYFWIGGWVGAQRVYLLPSQLELGTRCYGGRVRVRSRVRAGVRTRVRRWARGA